MKKTTVIGLIAAVLVVTTVVLIYVRNRSTAGSDTSSLGLGLHTPTPSPTPESGKLAMTDVNSLIPTPATTPVGSVQTLSDGLQYQDVTLGTGAVAKAGDTISVQYTGWLTDGTKFDSSLDHGKPFQFQLGAGMVIKGWDEGVAGMKVGGTRRLVIPPSLGYGAQGAGGVIPPNATLVFEVQLIGIQ